MKNVLLIGCDGYIGHALTLRLLEKGYSVFGIDDFQRRNHVNEMGSFSALPIDSIFTREKNLEDLFGHNYTFLRYDISNYNALSELNLPVPDVVVNLAQQPSAPFSLKSQGHATSTTINNLVGTINVLYYMKEFCPDAHLIQIGSMGEYDHAQGIDIAEGVFDFEFRGKVSKNAIFPRRPGSYYHASKVAATYYIDAACRWWGLTATDIMQGVVYGNWTPEIEKYGFNTRLDSDECFGTVINRFLVQAVIGEPLTIFGEGHQKRGYLALNDSIQCLMLAIENPPDKGEYRTWNQLDTVHTVNELATEVVLNGLIANIDTQNIPSPRAEKTGLFDHYHVDTDKLKYLGFKPTRNLRDEIHWTLKELLKVKDELYPLAEVVMPKITWR